MGAFLGRLAVPCRGHCEPPARSQQQEEPLADQGLARFGAQSSTLAGLSLQEEMLNVPLAQLLCGFMPLGNHLCNHFACCCNRNSCLFGFITEAVLQQLPLEAAGASTASCQVCRNRSSRRWSMALFQAVSVLRGTSGPAPLTLWDPWQPPRLPRSSRDRGPSTLSSTMTGRPWPSRHG